MEALPQFLPKQSLQYHSVVPMGSAEEVAVWERMDDVIMVRVRARVCVRMDDVIVCVQRSQCRTVGTTLTLGSTHMSPRTV